MRLHDADGNRYNVGDTDPSTTSSNFNNSPENVLKEIISIYPNSFQVSHNKILSIAAHFDELYVVVSSLNLHAILLQEILIFSSFSRFYYLCRILAVLA